MTNENMKKIQKAVMDLVDRLEAAENARDGEKRRSVLLQLKDELRKLVPLQPGNTRLVRLLKAVEEAASKEVYDPDDESLFDAVSDTLDEDNVTTWFNAMGVMYEDCADAVKTQGLHEVD